MFVTGLGGAAALSNAATATPSPPSASNYDSKVGPAFNGAIGYHWNDWISLQARYIWNRNQIVSTEVSGGNLRQIGLTGKQYAVASEILVYFRPRSSRIRPFLSAGPAWVRFSSQDNVTQNRLGWPVAVGADVMLRAGWGLRYSFSETMSANPFAASLNPPANTKLMNFQNLFGFVKVF